MIIKKNFPYNTFVYSYYKYLDKFKTEPQEWEDIFEFLDYNKTETKIAKYIEDMSQ